MVSFVIPALNEELNLPPLFERLLRIESELDVACEILVVDDASEDGTLRVSEEAGAAHPQIRGLHKPLPHGVGRGVRFGLEHARGSMVVVVMADGVDPLETAVPEFVRLVLHDGCRLVLLSRYVNDEDSASIPLSYKIFQAVFRFVTMRMMGQPFRDTTYAFRAFDTAFARSLDLRSDGFEISPEITFRAYFSGAKIGEVAGQQTRRVRGVSNFRFSGVAVGYARVLAHGLFMRWGLARRPEASS
jgi:dolichol-phosphate mannosyltransferase